MSDKVGGNGGHPEERKVLNNEHIAYFTGAYGGFDGALDNITPFVLPIP